MNLNSHKQRNAGRILGYSCVTFLDESDSWRICIVEDEPGGFLYNSPVHSGYICMCGRRKDICWHNNVVPYKMSISFKYANTIGLT